MTNSLNDSGIVGNPKQLLLEHASLHPFAELFPLAVQRLAEASSVALVRIWITKPPLPGDCSSCRFANECSNRERCLHLVASSGRSLNNSEENWQQVNGAFRRFPIGVRKVGKIAATGQSLEVANVEQDHAWVAHPDWIASMEAQFQEITETPGWITCTGKCM